jgi:hypothetical protein
MNIPTYRYRATLDDYNVVINVSVFESRDEQTEIEILQEYIKQNHLYEDLTDQEISTKIQSYIEEQKQNPENLLNMVEYSLDGSVTKNAAAIGYTYNETLNAFIPPKPEETYVLDTNSFEWYPDTNLIYDFDNGGTMCKARYSRELNGWTILN